MTETPTPRAVAAWVALGRLRIEDAPGWAALWLAAGYDGPALVAPAGLGTGDPRDIRDLLDEALAECGVPARPDAVGAQLDVWATDIAGMFLQGRAGYRWVVDKIVEMAGDHGERALPGLPLGALLRAGEVTEQTVREVCLEQIGHPRRRGTTDG